MRDAAPGVMPGAALLCAIGSRKQQAVRISRNKTYMCHAIEIPSAGIKKPGYDKKKFGTNAVRTDMLQEMEV